MTKRVYRNRIRLKEYILDCWKGREIAYMLALKDLHIRYRETVLGWLWALLQPLLTTLFLVFVFNKVGNLDTHGVAAILFAYSGYFYWGLISNNISVSAHILRNSRSMIRKIYFPRLLISTASYMVNSLETIISFILLLILWFVWGELSIYSELYTVAALLMSIPMSWGVTVFFSAINLRFRDLNYVVPMVLRMGLIITPIAFSMEAVPEQYEFWLYFNPATPFIVLFRYGLWGIPYPHYVGYFIVMWCILIPLFGVLLQKSMDKNIADIV